MKKETRVKFEDLIIDDLPDVLLNLLNHEHAPCVISGLSLASTWLNGINWQSVTDAERLAYCKVRYTDRLNVISTMGTKTIVDRKLPIYVSDNGCIYCNSGSCELYYNGKFAEIIEDEVSIKEKLKGTCVLNEKEGMGAEIVKLYTEAGFQNAGKKNGGQIGGYYGIINGDVWCGLRDEFESVITLDQLRSIVRGGMPQKPPIGIIPEFLWKEKRQQELTAAINRYKNEGLEYPKEWDLELSKLSESVEFKEGEMVDEYISDILHQRVIYRFYADGKHWVSEDRDDNSVYSPEKIRKIDLDSDLKKIADEVIKKHYDFTAPTH